MPSFGNVTLVLVRREVRLRVGSLVATPAGWRTRSGKYPLLPVGAPRFDESSGAYVYEGRRVSRAVAEDLARRALARERRELDVDLGELASERFAAEREEDGWNVVVPEPPGDFDEARTHGHLLAEWLVSVHPGVRQHYLGAIDVEVTFDEVESDSDPIPMSIAPQELRDATDPGGILDQYLEKLRRIELGLSERAPTI